MHHPIGGYFVCGCDPKLVSLKTTSICPLSVCIMGRLLV